MPDDAPVMTRFAAEAPSVTENRVQTEILSRPPRPGVVEGGGIWPKDVWNGLWLKDDCVDEPLAADDEALLLANTPPKITAGL